MKDTLVYLCLVNSLEPEQDALSVKCLKDTFNSNLQYDLIWSKDIWEISKGAEVQKLLVHPESEYVLLAGSIGQKSLVKALEHKSILNLQVVPLETCFKNVQEQLRDIKFNITPKLSDRSHLILESENAQSLITDYEANKLLVLNLIKKNKDDLGFLTETNDINRQIILPI